MPEPNTNPTVSFILFAYKQEKFVSEAVDSALAQTYCPLEIILSDDCSPDATFAIMQERAACYRGPHKVVLLRNEVNLGLAAHINQAFSRATGDIVIMAAGDDISVPERTSWIVRRMIDSESPVDAVVSYFAEIDISGKPTGYVKKEAVMFTPDTAKPVRQWTCGATGACAAYRRMLYERYGPINREVTAEDWVFSFRAWLGAGIGLIKEPLVLHRTHDESISVMIRKVAQVSDRRVRYLRRRKIEAGALAIAQEWQKAWLIDRAGKSPTTERELEAIVRFRQAKLDAFDSSPIELLGAMIRLLLQGEFVSVGKVFIRHGLRIY